MEKQSNIRLSLDQGLAIQNDMQADLSSAALAEILGVSKAHLLRRSVDARKKNNVHFIATAAIDDGKDCELLPQEIIPLAQQDLPRLKADADKEPVVVVGAGPAGLFAALELAHAGYAPVVIERGSCVEQRKQDVERYQQTGVLNTQSNVQFGEGGAGTFSDGKLTCGKNSPLMQKVLETFVAAGAPLDILWQAKPHIGTDILSEVVIALRERIIACGGSVLFNTQVTSFDCDSSGALCGVELDSGEVIATRNVILACGHSARDTFAMLKALGVAMEQKPFSLGVRIEHLQQAISRAQYGKAAKHPALGAADYKLSVHLQNGRGVYTFCMCPGGQVMTASSEEGRLCVNGMSYHARASKNANAALLVGLTPEDYQSYGQDISDPLAGVQFQRHWEQRAFELGGSDWKAPVQMVGDYVSRSSKGASSVTPSYALGVKEASLQECLPQFTSESIAQALPLLGRKLQGFDDAGAVMTGIEARSSSPVRIVRDAQTLQSVSLPGLYPCGEGAGYAGGIMSAAIDGIRCAQQAIARLEQDLS